MLDYLNQSPKKVALLGPDDNDLAKTVGAIASLRRYKLLQVLSIRKDELRIITNGSKFHNLYFELLYALITCTSVVAAIVFN